MSVSAPADDLDIRGGGVVAVDTQLLRDAAARLTLLAAACDRVHDVLARATGILLDAGIWLYPPAREATAAGTDAAAIAADLRSLADTYEFAELAAELEVARAAGDLDVVARLTGRQRELADADPLVSLRAAWLTGQWRLGVGGGLVDQFEPTGSSFGSLALLLNALLAVVTAWGHGTPDRPLTGSAEPVSTPVLRRSATTAPESLEQLLARMPGGGDSRIRIEEYTMPDGSHEYVAYAAGTQTVAPGASSDAFDMRSNIELYSGERAASYDAMLQALADSGARPGDTVHLVGYSQGAMVVSAVALAGTYTVSTIITAGNPVQPAVGGDTLSVALRHRDDPVSALSDGGRAGGTGATGSFVAERTVERPPWDDGALAAHEFDEYLATARQLDDSSDPRMDAVRDLFTELEEAASVEVTVYGAERPAPPPQPAPEVSLELFSGGTSAADAG
ncbi:hypothetical protein [Microbacterium sp.]|uniref:hypothetical protein n=1 Tax=Microbacterium sp. TaxID=51671 RepID=UPI0039E227E2